MIRDVTGILLAGGKSRRMGQDKKLLYVGEETLFDRSLNVVRAIFHHVHIVIAQDSPPLQAPVKVYRDIVPGCGSLGGVLTGLVHATTPHVFVAACDMPFLSPSVIHYLVGKKEGVDIVVVQTPAGFQVTHALYGKGCIPFIEGMIQRDHLKIQDLVDNPGVKVRLIEWIEIEKIDSRALTFINVNTPQELEKAQKLNVLGQINDLDRKM